MTANKALFSINCPDSCPTIISMCECHDKATEGWTCHSVDVTTVSCDVTSHWRAMGHDVGTDDGKGYDVGSKGLIGRARDGGSQAGDVLRHRVVPVMRRIRWERVIVATGVALVPFALFSGTASSHEIEHMVIDESFIGPRATVGYSPITNAERKAMAEEEIRQRKIANGELVEGQEEAEGEPELLSSADDRYQHEGDLDFTDANRDNLITRAIGSWRRPTWLSDVDWDAIRDSLVTEVDGEQVEIRQSPEEDDTPDETIAGYDDIARLAFMDGTSFTWTAPNGQTLSYDGGTRLSGDLPVCLDMQETVLSGHHAIYALDREADGEGKNTIQFDNQSMEYSSTSLEDKVVPDEEKGSMTLGTVSGKALRTATFDRRRCEVEVTRADREEGDDSHLYVSLVALRPKGRLSNESVTAYVKSSKCTDLRVWVSCLGVSVYTTDIEGLRDVEVEMRYVIDGNTGTATETFDGGEASAFVDLSKYVDTGMEQGE